MFDEEGGVLSSAKCKGRGVHGDEGKDDESKLEDHQEKPIHHQSKFQPFKSLNDIRNTPSTAFFWK